MDTSPKPILPDQFKDFKPVVINLISEKSTLIQVIHLLAVIRNIINSKKKAKITLNIGYIKNSEIQFSVNDTTIPDYKSTPEIAIN